MSDPTSVDFVYSELVYERLSHWLYLACTRNDWRLAPAAIHRIHQLRLRAAREYMAFFQ